MAGLAGKKRSAPSSPATETPAKEPRLSEGGGDTGSKVEELQRNSNLGGGGAEGDGSPAIEPKTREKGAVTGEGVATDSKR